MNDTDKLRAFEITRELRRQRIRDQIWNSKRAMEIACEVRKQNPLPKPAEVRGK